MKISVAAGKSVTIFLYLTLWVFILEDALADTTFGQDKEPDNGDLNARNLDLLISDDEPADEKNKGDFFEGDVILTAEQKAKLKEMERNDKSKDEKRKFLKEPLAKKWPGGIVYYQPFPFYTTDKKWQRAIESSMRLVTSQTSNCIQFRKSNSGPRIKFSALRRLCASELGRIDTNIGQIIWISNPGCTKIGIIAHEILHALGFLHEQSRPDRDNYVTINYGNIKSGTAGNFRKYPTGAVDTGGVPYDYASIMHYGGKAFAQNTRHNTITAKDSTKQSVMGQRIKLSEHDIAIVKKIYKCTGSATVVTSSCTDRFSSCPTYKARGYCRYYVYWATYCPKSCHGCRGPRCYDRRITSLCQAQRSVCTRSIFVRFLCRKTCDKCSTYVFG